MTGFEEGLIANTMALVYQRNNPIPFEVSGKESTAEKVQVRLRG